MTTQIRITITANNSGDYTVINRCYFATTAFGETPVSPSSYFGSSDLYEEIYNFQQVYLQAGVWHSSWPGVPLIGGIVCAEPIVLPRALVIQNTGDVATRAPKDFIVELSEDSGATWTTLTSVTNQTDWAAGEVRRFLLVAKVAISGNVIVAGNGGADQVVIRNWTTRELIERVTPASNGDWAATVPEGQYDITYFAANCQPVCHGPYTVTAD